MNYRKTACSLIFLTAATMVGFPATAETVMNQPWSNQEFIASKGPLKDVLIIAVTRRPQNRPMLEEAFVKQFAQTKATAISSISIMPPDVEVTEKTVKAAEAAAGKKFEIVLLSRLYRVDEVDILNVTDIGTKRSERDFALALWKDWRDAYDYALDADVTKRRRYVLDNNVYYLENAELIWTIQSHSMDPDSVEEIIKEVSKQVTKTLEKENLI